MPAPPPLPAKQDVALTLLEGPWMFVHLDPRREGVTVPRRFRDQPQVVLQLGYRLALPIRDLAVTAEGIAGTLSFSRRPFFCQVPWPAVFALVGEDGRGMVWPDDVPPELALVGQRPKLARVPSDGAPKKGRKRPRRPASAPSPSEEAVPPPADELRAEGSPETSDRGADRPALAVVPGPGEPGHVRPGSRRRSPAAEPPHGARRQRGGKPRLPPYLRVVK